MAAKQIDENIYLEDDYKEKDVVDDFTDEKPTAPVRTKKSTPHADDDENNDGEPAEEVSDFFGLSDKEEE